LKSKARVKERFISYKKTKYSENISFFFFVMVFLIPMLKKSIGF